MRLLKRFLSYYKPHKLLFSLDMGASLLVALSGIVYPVVTRTMLHDLIPNRQYRMIVIYGLSLLVIYLVRMGLNFFIQYKGHMMGTQMQAAMRSDLFTHLEKLPFSFFDEHETGKIMSRMTTDLFDITELAHHGPENLIITSISVIVSFAYLMHINVMLSIIVFLVVPFLIGVSNYMRTRMRSAFTRSRQATAVINASLENSISGIRVTKAFTNSAKETEKFEHGNTLFKEASRDAYKAMGQFHSGTTFITDIFNVVILIAGGLFLYDGKITFADYSAFIVSINLFLGPVNTLIRFMEQYQSGVAGFERFVEVLDMKPEMDRDGAKDVPRLKGEIEFDDVTFAYDGEHDVLKHIDMKIKPGQTFALVGPSGGGKTTICHL
ncbi:MAG: ABC transporter ATP-binding protein, partial [Victivallales bacterium]|nr:ABC transporter ATP-binding protein [Victivallales bacterium]